MKFWISHSMVLLSILASSLSVPLSWGDEVQKPSVCVPRIGSCDYYLCRESLQPCGKDGYFLRFGHHYCTTFIKQLEPEVSRPERLWLYRVASCLQQKVEEIPLGTSCKKTEDLAIASHRDCYVETGFCKMPFSMKLKLFGIAHSELTDSRMLNVFLEILGQCGSQGELLDTPII